MIRLVLIGHLGFARDVTPAGAAVSLGGSGYACAKGATVGQVQRIGLVAVVGSDFAFSALNDLGLDLHGVSVVAGPSPRLSITQYPDSSRAFKGELGVAARAHPEIFPYEYQKARHVHLATMPPIQQREWLKCIKRVAPSSSVSVDMFESTVLEEPGLSRELCQLADLVFLNRFEFDVLFENCSAPSVPLVLKDGPRGASYVSGRSRIDVPAPMVQAVDTTGAGEVLAGAFLALMDIGLPVREALTYAVEVASATVEEFGVDGPQAEKALTRVREIALHPRRSPDRAGQAGAVGGLSAHIMSRQPSQ